MTPLRSLGYPHQADPSGADEEQADVRELYNSGILIKLYCVINIQGAGDAFLILWIRWWYNWRKKGEKMSEKHEIDDDCPICRAMRDGSANTMGGLMNAFEEAKKQGAIVGGEYFDKKNQTKK